ncbi:odorant receptor 13a isoform X1 [Diachasma alloeum]|uniref:Odorant receptor n=1 Tax=Diachasma alloeum TaxID=454923 RepID=A0A4E0RP75_9HYME|nr:odorant receptor 13a isoform X1 [Diachasma alloeum]THK33216.1 odorant receptor 153 [Diachasma alloeum]
MDFWDQIYFKPMKIVSCLAGQWPYQSPMERTIIRSLLVAAVGSQIISQIAAVAEHSNDLDFFMELVPPFVVELTCFTKMINCFFFLGKIKILLEQLQENWKFFPSGRENELLREHSLFGFQMSVLFIGTLYISGFVFGTQPFQAIILHFVLNSNGSVPHQFLFPANWGPIDADKYYFPLISLSALSIYCVVTMLVAIDCVFYTCCGHVCGLFAALGHSIEHFNFNNDPQLGDDGFAFLRRCIQIHNRVLEFISVMEDVLTVNFLIMLGSVTMAMSLTAVQMVINFDAVVKLLKNLAFAITQVTQLAIKCWMAQRVMDMSLNIKFSLINSKWYLASPKTQKLIGLMIMRSEIPCEITAGKVIVMCLETFSSTVRLSASYFTMFLALR